MINKTPKCVIWVEKRQHTWPPPKGGWQVVCVLSPALLNLSIGCTWLTFSLLTSNFMLYPSTPKCTPKRNLRVKQNTPFAYWHAHKHFRHVCYRWYVLSCYLHVGLAVLQVRHFLTLVVNVKLPLGYESILHGFVFSHLWESCWSAHQSCMSLQKNSKHPIRRLISMCGTDKVIWSFEGKVQVIEFFLYLLYNI